MDTGELREMLDAVKVAQHAPREDNAAHQKTWSNMHALAEARFLPALDFFVSCLDDDRWEWRINALRCIGFHYRFPADGAIAEKIRRMLLTDVGGFGQVRMAAASVLGGRSTWPDLALETALKTDPDEDVRRVAFAALLTIGGIPYKVVRAEVQKTKVGESQPT
ncbi:MAG: hypothetical protein H0X37_11960, partial [Herpetosiphonaceae bacterium]|nr:hypothetical protein [Herpetosiphonaceae bacterium]